MPKATRVEVEVRPRRFACWCSVCAQEEVEDWQQDLQDLQEQEEDILPGALPEEWELRELRGFSMRQGRRGRIMRRARPAPEILLWHLDRASRSGELYEPSALLLPGRSKFGRQAGNYRHQPRCSMCRPGRHRGAGGKKARKKVGNSHCRVPRARWLSVVREARSWQGEAASAVEAYALEADDVAYGYALKAFWQTEAASALEAPAPIEQRPPAASNPRPTSTAPAPSEPQPAAPPPPPAVARRQRASRAKASRRAAARCLCCRPADGSPSASSSGSFVDTGLREAWFEEWLLV